MKTNRLASALMAVLAILMVACNADDIITVVTKPAPKQGAVISTRSDPLFGGCAVRTDLVAVGVSVGATPSIQIGGMLDISIVETFTPAGCGVAQGFIGTSSDTTKAKVSSLDTVTVRVTGVANGSVNVCAIGKLRTSVTLCGAISVGTVVVNPSCSVTSVTVTPATIGILVSGNTQLTPTVVSNPASCAPSTVTWSVTGVGTVSNTGLVTSNAGAGTITVTARSTFDTTRFGIATITVTATPPTATITGFTLNPKLITLITGQTSTPIVLVRLSDSTTLTGVNARGRFTCASKNTLIAMVNDTTCQITAVAVGSAYVVGTTTSASIIKDSVLVVVSSPTTITGFTLNPKLITLLVSQIMTPAIVVALSDSSILTGANATGRFTCVSRNTLIATVDASTCRITAVGVGSAYVVGTTTGIVVIRDSVLVTVSPSAQVFINPTSFILHMGASCPATFQPVVTVIPASAGPVKWSITNRGAASVDSLTGLTTRIAAGVDTIKAIPVGAPTVMSIAVVTVDNLPCTNPITLSLTQVADSGAVGTFDLATYTVTPVGTPVFFTSSDPARVAVMSRDTTYAVVTNGWPVGFHQAGKIQYRTIGTAQICVVASVNPAVSACGLWKTQ